MFNSFKLKKLKGVKNKMVTFTQEEKDFIHELMEEYDEEEEED